MKKLMLLRCPFQEIVHRRIAISETMVYTSHERSTCAIILLFSKLFCNQNQALNLFGPGLGLLMSQNKRGDPFAVIISSDLLLTD